MRGENGLFFGLLFLTYIHHRSDHLHHAAHTVYCGENPVFIRVLYAYIGIRDRSGVMLFDRCASLRPNKCTNVIDCAAR